MAKRTTVNVSLTPQLGRFVQAHVESGLYQSVSEVVRDALRLLEARQIPRSVAIERLNAHLEEGYRQGKAGKVVTPEQFKRTLAKRQAAARRKAG